MRSPKRSKNEKQSGVEPGAAQEPLRIPPDATGTADV
jgi:hypothetical protein